MKSVSSSPYLFASPTSAAVADFRVHSLLSELAFIGPVGLQTRVSGLFPKTFSSTCLQIIYWINKTRNAVPTQHPVEQFAGTSALLPPMRNRRAPRKKDEMAKKNIFPNKSATCNYQKSHFECQGTNNCEYLFKLETKKITCGRKADVLRRSEKN